VQKAINFSRQHGRWRTDGGGHSFWPTMTRRNARCAYTQAQMNVGSVGAVAGILIVILAAVYIWLVRSGHGD